MFKSFLSTLFHHASQHNRNNILQSVKDLSPTHFLDLGCDNGEWTLQVAAAAKAQNTSGIELVAERAAEAQRKFIHVYLADLAKKFPIEDSSFDLVHANQVIEHVADLDLFASEIFRVLKPGGTVLISTENGSSWHNLFAAFLGWQTFSLTNMSKLKAGVGYPLSLHRNESIEFGTWTHKVIFNYRGLIEFIQLHGFEVVQIKGADYYPLASSFASFDPRHAHFLTISARKPKRTQFHSQQLPESRER